jgi:hypothetical protein
MHVVSVVTGTENAGQGKKRGKATVTVHDNLWQPVASATVTGTFSGTFNEMVSGATGSDGVVVLKTTATASGGVTVNFCVDDVVHSTLTYDPSENGSGVTGCSSGGKVGDLRDTEEEARFHLEEPHPNPFNPTTTIAFSLQEEGVVSLTIHNMLGQLVDALVDRQSYSAGRHTVMFDAANLASGTYFVRLTSSAGQLTKQVQLLK